MSTLCRLQLAVGHVTTCPKGACPFWEEGGAALEPGCAVERLAVDLERPDLAGYLLDLQRQLEAARGREEREQARKSFAALIPPGFR